MRRQVRTLNCRGYGRGIACAVLALAKLTQPLYKLRTSLCRAACFAPPQKLLEKMGWKEGEGLGRNRQGMATPLMMQVGGCLWWECRQGRKEGS